MIIRAVNITKSFPSGGGTIEVLKGINLELKRGEMLAIMGVSGSGKSTLLHILGLISPPDSGELYFNSERVDFSDTTMLAKRRNKQIGFVFQFYSLISELNVLENVMLPAMIGGLTPDRAKALRLLELVGFDPSMANRMVYKLSGGQMQRVAIARALMNDPDVVIADEPTANLDKASSIDIVTTMRNINLSSGKSFIIATHSGEVARRCDRILLLSGGVISEESVT